MNGVTTWYGSRSERGAWAELFRHFTDDDVDPFEVRRRIGRADIEVVVLDLTKPQIREALGVDYDELIADGLQLCQELAELARIAGFEAIHAPSAALPGERNLAIFGSAIEKLHDVLDKGIRRAPPRMCGMLGKIRSRILQSGFLTLYPS